MSKYNANTKVTFSVSTGYSGCRRSQTYTLGELGYEDFDEELMESWVQRDYEQWLFENIDGGWSLEDE